MIWDLGGNSRIQEVAEDLFDERVKGSPKAA
jgi:hypothetical protein